MGEGTSPYLSLKFKQIFPGRETVTLISLMDANMKKTRMHSSRMRTGRSLTVFWSLLLGGGVPSPWGCTWSWGVYLVLGGVPGPRGCTWSWGVPGRGGTWSGGCTWSWGGVPGLWGWGVPGPRGHTPAPPCGQNHRRL